MKKFILALVLIVVIVLASSVAKNEGSKSQNVIKIGALLPLTGKISSFGEDVKNGLEIAKKELESEGISIEIIYEDSAGDPKIALPTFQKLINVDGVDVVIGGPGSTANLVVAPVAEEKEVAFVVLSSSNGVANAGEYTFKFIPDIKDEVRLIAQRLQSEEVKSVTVLYDLSSDSNVTAKDTFVEIFGSIEGNKVFDEGFDGNSTADFRGVVSKVKSENPEAVYVLAVDKISALVISQMRELNLEQQVYSWSGVENQTFIDNAGENAEGTIVTGLPYSCFGNEGQEEFCENYKKSFDGRESGYYGASAYALLKIIAKSADKEDFKDSVMRSLTSSDHDTLLGNFSFDELGNIFGVEFILREVKDGQFVPVE